MTVPDGGDQARRIAQRRRVLKAARIVYGNGERAIDCIIRDVSETGAQIDTETTVELPRSFSLCFPDGQARPVELVWQNSNLLGIRFADLPPHSGGCSAGDSTSALIARLAEIERQLAELRAELASRLRD